MVQRNAFEELQENIAIHIQDELAHYEEQIRKYRAGELDETKMQKLRLHFGTYAQRQEGVQMQRIKIPGGVLNSDQLTRLADAADRYGSGFMHFTTREDVQLYYVKLEEAPSLLRFLAEAGITTREACGNTVRNVTACYRAGTAHDEIFDVSPYAEGLFRYLVRNKYNQNLGRKFKIAFEGCTEDHSRLRIHDIGLLAATRQEDSVPRRGFRVFLGGGLGAAPYLAHLYTEFLPEEELLNLAASVLVLFDRYGERKTRMKARLKFLIQKMGWDSFREALDKERQRLGKVASLGEYLQEVPPLLPDIPPSTAVIKVLDPRVEDPGFQRWAQESIVEHKIPGFRGVHVRLKLGDLTADRARTLADLAQRFSSCRLRISIEQNIYLPWVREEDLPDLHFALGKFSQAEPGAETISDVTTCPGADTCRLGIASAKGLGNAISEAFEGTLAGYRDLARSLRVKVSGCPNGCAQHSVADIGFHAAAFTHDGRTVPAYFVSVGGKANLDDTAFGQVIGKFPARNCVEVMRVLFAIYQAEKNELEDLKSFVARLGVVRLSEVLAPFRAVPAFADDPTFFQDFGHENERFAVRQGIKGECAGSTVAETVPTVESAREWLAQAEAFLYHEEYQAAMLAAYEAAGHAARVPLYARLVDPFTSLEALWEFENIFVLSGQTQGDWRDFWSSFEELKGKSPGESAAREIIERAKSFIDYCTRFSSQPQIPQRAAARA